MGTFHFDWGQLLDMLIAFFVALKMHDATKSQ